MVGMSTVLAAALSVGRSGHAQPTSEGRQQTSQPNSIEQAKQKGFEGVDFYYDVFGAPPGQDPQKSFEQVMKKDQAEKPEVMAKQRKLLEERYDLSCKQSPGVTMTKGKPQPVGPAVRLPAGMTWEQLAQMGPDDIRKKRAFPAGFDRLPHPKHAVGGQVFPQIQIKQFPRLERFDVDFDLPECLLPEFPPPIFLTIHPELGDVSQGEVLHADNFDRLFRGLVTPAQLDGLRMLVTQFAQEEFNATHDRKSAKPSLGVTCLDCHVNFHTTAQFHLNPDTRPQLERLRLDTPSLRGMFNQQIHGSKRSIRSVEDFTEFEQRTAYFNGDPIRAMKKGMNLIDRVLVAHMGQMQNMIDFPPAPHLDPMTGRLDRTKATPLEVRGEDVFFGKGRCAACHLPPSYTDHQMHDLHLERFGAAADGPIKTFALRGIKDSPPYFHDGRLPTLEDTVEFFNIVGGLKLDQEEKKALAAFMRAL
ncbi:Cytochrome C [Nitrospira moscoviensis]|uniref:Cytochrome C n=2 Tax=Nitrospira moscoviensis TaxID=42253 RepID=A0A0K2GE90_NITMO|nr:Cytochrome C [Nitrospira moscoviensis]